MVRTVGSSFLLAGAGPAFPVTFSAGQSLLCRGWLSRSMLLTTGPPACLCLRRPSRYLCACEVLPPFPSALICLPVGGLLSCGALRPPPSCRSCFWPDFRLVLGAVSCSVQCLLGEVFHGGTVFFGVRSIEPAPVFSWFCADSQTTRIIGVFCTWFPTKLEIVERSFLTSV